jgi:RimJ/RimL family protein N-acetyltransferase
MIQLTDGELVGMAGLWRIDAQARNAEVGLKVGLASARSRGVGTDTVRTLTRFAFEDLGLHRVWARILTGNRPSLRVFVEKCGWKEEGRLRQAAFRDGAYQDVVVVGLLREEFRP